MDILVCAKARKDQFLPTWEVVEEEKKLHRKTEKRWVDGAMQPNYKLLQPIRSVSFLWFFNFLSSIVFVGCASWWCSMVVVCATSFVFLFVHTFFGTFSCGFRSLFHVDVCLIFRDERIKWNWVRLKGAKLELQTKYTFTHTQSMLSRLNSLFFFHCWYECVCVCVQS